MITWKHLPHATSTNYPTHMNDMTMDAPKRPTLLTVICILSFIFGAFSLWSDVKNGFTDAPAEELAEAKAKIEESMEQMGDAGSSPMVQEMMESTMAMAEKSVEHAKPMAYAGLVLTIIGLLGVWMMWNLKKNGFWLYLVSTIGSLVVPMIYLGGGLMTILGLGFVALFYVLFIILYAVNLKHMH